jgi:hypothetical protein
VINHTDYILQKQNHKLFKDFWLKILKNYFDHRPSHPSLIFYKLKKEAFLIKSIGCSAVSYESFFEVEMNQKKNTSKLFLYISGTTHSISIVTMGGGI